jgi:hypothetical protein
MGRPERGTPRSSARPCLAPSPAISPT